MKLSQSFNVAAPIDEVWAALTEIERVAPCLPGAELTGSEDDVYHGTFSVKLGPASAAYQGTLRMDTRDESSHTATMTASGRDKRGQGAANATIVSQLEPVGDETKVRVETDLTITGRLARFGRGGMIADVSERLLDDFAGCLRQELAGEPRPAREEVAPQGGSAARETGAPPRAAQAAAPRRAPARPVSGLALFWRVLTARVRRLFRRPRTG